MAKSIRLSVRISEETANQIAALGCHWGPIRALNQAEVVAVAVGRCFGAEIPVHPAPKKSKKSRQTGLTTSDNGVQ
jgi:hypothetical protein